MCLISSGGFAFVLNIGYFPFLEGLFPYEWEHSGSHEASTVLLREEVIIFSWCSGGLSLIERNLKKWNLSAKSSCIRRETKIAFIWGLCCATEDVPEDILHAVKVAWMKHYGDLTVLNWKRSLRYGNFIVVKTVG